MATVRYSNNRHCAPTGRRKAPPDDKLLEAIQSVGAETKGWMTF
jgi:hypothetical protein